LCFGKKKGENRKKKEFQSRKKAMTKKIYKGGGQKSGQKKGQKESHRWSAKKN